MTFGRSSVVRLWSIRSKCETRPRRKTFNAESTANAEITKENLTERGQIKSRDHLVVGDGVDDNIGVGGRGDFCGVVGESDHGAGEIGRAAIAGSGVGGLARDVQGIDEFVALEETIAKVAPEIGRAELVA